MMFDLPEQKHQSKEFSVFGIVWEGWLVIGYATFLIFTVCGCGGQAGFTNISDTPRKGVTDKPSAEIKEQASGLTAFAKAVEVKQDTAITLIQSNAATLARIETKLEASLSAPKPNSEEVIQSAQNPPAKANTQQTPLKVATPGDFSRVASDGTRLRWNIEGNWNPTILETSAHLREHGIDTDGMTHQEMADIHASIHDGKPVAAKSETVRYVSRGTNCPNGQCPTSSTRYVRRSRR